MRSSGVAGRRASLVLSRAAGEEVRGVPLVLSTGAGDEVRGVPLVLSRAAGDEVRGVPLVLSRGTGDEVRGVPLALSRGTGEEVRGVTLAGVRALLGRALGVEGLGRPEGGLGLGETAGQGEEGLPLGVEGELGRCLDKGLGLGSGLCLMLGKDCLFFRTLSLERAFFSFSFSRSLSFFSFFFLSMGVESRLRWVMSGVLEVTLQRSEQRWAHRVRGLAEAERGHRGDRPSLPLPRTLAALRLRARKARVGVISRSTMLLSHGLSWTLRFLPGEFQRVAEDLERRLFRGVSTCLGRLTADTEHLLSLWLAFCPPAAQEPLCWRISAQVFLVDLWRAAS